MLSHFSSVIVNSNLPLSNRRGANVSFGGQELVYQEYEILYVDLDFDGHELIQLSDVGDNVVILHQCTLYLQTLMICTFTPGSSTSSTS